MPLKKPSTKKPVTKKPKDGAQPSKGVQGPFKVVKKRDGNYPVKLY
jgi:hypothetical protein